jgi:hypothetical protein
LPFPRGHRPRLNDVGQHLIAQLVEIDFAGLGENEQHPAQPLLPLFIRIGVTEKVCA